MMLQTVINRVGSLINKKRHDSLKKEVMSYFFCLEIQVLLLYSP